MKTIQEEDIAEIAATNFSRWNAALKTKDHKKVVKLYSETATFLPTLSAEFYVGRNGAGAYFEHFLLKKPEGKIIEEKIQTFGNTEAYVHSGLYNFTVDSADGDRKVVNARFTFVWTKNEEGEWKIAHHHSSLVPKG